MSPIELLRAELAQMLRESGLPTIDENAFEPSAASNKFIEVWSSNPSMPVNKAWLKGMTGSSNSGAKPK